MKRMLSLTVPHAEQRYPTCGDYQEAHGVVVFRISDLGNEDYEALVLVHELVEYLLVKKRGLPIETIDAFDIAFEQQRDLGDESEPGDAPDAPYRREHRFAENIERQLAHELGVDWHAYERAIGELP